MAAYFKNNKICLLGRYIAICTLIVFKLQLATGKKVKVLVTQSCPTLCDLRTVTHQTPLSMGFSR